MKLDYSILWIDDRPRQIEHAIEHVRVKLARKGFDLNVKMLQEVGNDASLGRHFRNQDYDLLVVDYKMQPDERTGDQLIRSIRRFCDSTDIVFYSSDTPDELRKVINVDGVYCVNRNDLGTRLDHVIHSTIKKALDLNNMRGISLAQIADFDHLIDEVINLGYEKLQQPDIKPELIEKICETACSYHATTNKKIDELSRTLPISEYTTLLSSEPKFNILLDIINHLNNKSLDACVQRVSNYSVDVIQPRNKLAHAMEKKFHNGRYLLENNTKEISFNYDDFTSLRIKLLEYRDLFGQIKTEISSI